MPSSQQDPASQRRKYEQIRTATVSLPAGCLRAGLSCPRVSPEVRAPVQTALWPAGEGKLGGLGIFLVRGIVMSSQNMRTGRTCSLSHWQGVGGAWEGNPIKSAHLCRCGGCASEVSGQRFDSAHVGTSLWHLPLEIGNILPRASSALHSGAPV